MGVKSRTSIPSYYLFAILVVVLGVPLVAYLSRVEYYIIETHGGGSAIWRQDEAFIFVEKGMSAKVMTRFQAVLEGLGGGLYGPFFHWPEKLHEDVIVFHITGHKSERYYLNDFGHGGGATPASEEVYFRRGGRADDWPRMWQWTGTNFLGVTRAEASRIVDQYPPDGSVRHSKAKQIEREGWYEVPSFIFNSSREMRYPMRLQDRDVSILTTRSDRSGSSSAKESVVLEGRLEDDSREILSEIQDGDHYRPVSRQEYLKMKDRSG
jgi:hypothetical protein